MLEAAHQPGGGVMRAQGRPTPDTLGCSWLLADHLGRNEIDCVDDIAAQANVMAAFSDTLCARLDPHVAHAIAATDTGARDPQQWPMSEGFFLSVIATRAEQVFRSVRAAADLHELGHIEAEWAVLEQGTDALARLWALTEFPLIDTHLAQAQAAAACWQALPIWAEAVGVVVKAHPRLTELKAPRPAETGHWTLDDVGDATDEWVELLDAIGAGAALARCDVPVSILTRPDLTSEERSKLALHRHTADVRRMQTVCATELVQHAGTALCRGFFHSTNDERWEQFMGEITHSARFTRGLIGQQ
ncbi:hypothetical protein ABIC28_001623 [Rhodococcus sp. PvR044]|uniref:hypothetical protein n=1 Tax=Rhodococcus sp. PvR044 TaxID=3156402 RepID=UPI00339919BF